MTVIDSGVIMRHSGDKEFSVYPDRTQREVHPARREESLSYRITSDDRGVHHFTADRERWDHYTYVFTYRYLGRQISITWHCGTGYGTPRATDGLESAIRDARAVEWEGFGPSWAADLGYDWETDRAKAQRIYNACERMNERLDRLFGDPEERGRWEQALGED